ncbi:MAG: hypothetical protein H5U37_04265 [Caldisericia bacterium]|nr:hypothetical protein [Caldisericia bacterium]
MERYESPTIETVGMDKGVQDIWYAENIWVVGEAVFYASAAAVMYGVALIAVVATVLLVWLAGKTEE